MYIIDNWNTSGKVIVDVNFENKLRELSEAIERLVKQAERANKTDIAIQEQITVLLKRYGCARYSLFFGVWSVIHSNNV